MSIQALEVFATRGPSISNRGNAVGENFLLDFCSEGSGVRAFGLRWISLLATTQQRGLSL